MAEAIAGYLAGAEVMDVTGRRHRGLLAGADLAGWRASAEAPVTLDYAGLTVCKTGPWGQGPVFLQQLRAAGRVRPGGDGPGQRRLHPHGDRVRQARLRRPGGLVRRSAVADVPLDGLLSPSYAAQRRGPGRRGRRRRLICGRARPAAGAAPARLRAAPQAARAAVAARADAGVRGAARRRELPAGREPGDPGDTCHLDVADRFGNLVSATPQRRLAAELAGHPRPRLLPGHPGADVHARRRAWPARWPRARGRGPRSRRAWRCATASRTWPSARPAGISRTSGRWRSSSGTCSSG